MNAVAPGTIYSETAASNYSIDVFEMARPEIPAKRTGTPEEVELLVQYLKILFSPNNFCWVSKNNIVDISLSLCFVVVLADFFFRVAPVEVS